MYLRGMGLNIPGGFGGGGDVFSDGSNGGGWGGVFNDGGGTGINMLATATAFIPVAGPFISMALSLEKSIENALGVGKGRNEANKIVEVQNQLDDLVRRIQDARQVPNVSTSDLQSMLQVLNDAWNQFRNFVNNRQAFPDGRASAQALETETPGVTAVLAELRRMIQARGGMGYPPMLTQGPGPARLTFPIMGETLSPQAGYLPQGYQAAGVYPAEGGNDWWLLAAAVAAVLMLRR